MDSAGTGDSGIGRRGHAADAGSERSVWMGGAIPPPKDEVVIRVQSGGDGWV